jgi:hypothetical protein
MSNKSQSNKQAKQSKKNNKNQKSRQSAPSNDNYGVQLTNVVKHGLGATLRMYPSTLNFGRVYGDPFSKEGARLPVMPILPTKMLRTVASGNGMFNSSGVFFLTAIPVNCATSDQYSVYFGNQASSPPFITTDDVTYTIGKALSKSPFTRSQFPISTENGLALRLVSFGLRVKYTGTVFNASGTCFSAQTAPKVAMTDYGVDDIKKMQGYKENAFRSGSWHCLTRHMTEEADKSFIAYNSSLGYWQIIDNFTYSREGLNYLGMVCTGTAGSPVEWEVVGHYEIIGPNLEAVKVAHVDTAGTEQIVNAFQKKRDKDSTTPDHTVGDSGFKKFINTIVSGAEKLLPLLPSVLALL